MLKPQNFDKDGAINLSLFHDYIKSWEIYFGLQDLGVEICGKLPRNFRDAQDHVKKSIKHSTTTDWDDYFIAAVRNK